MRKYLFILFALIFVACSDEDNDINPLLFNHWRYGEDGITLSIYKDGTFAWGLRNSDQSYLPITYLPITYLITQGRWEATGNKLLLVAYATDNWTKERRQFRYKITNKKDGINDYYELEMQEYDLITHKTISSPLHFF